MKNTLRICTLGHSDRSAAEMIELLEAESIDCVVDIRSHPVSRRHPQFSQQALRELLDRHEIRYHWAGRQLGGRQHEYPEFADYMQTGRFKVAVMQLINLAEKSRLCLLCAERLPEYCHRSLVSDVLLLQGVQVVHLIEKGVVQPHRRQPVSRH